MLNTSYIKLLKCSNKKIDILTHKTYKYTYKRLFHIHHALSENKKKKYNMFCWKNITMSSVKKRFKLAWPKIIHYPKIMIKDSSNRPLIRSTPKIRRTSIAPTPWIINSYILIFKKLFNKKKFFQFLFKNKKKCNLEKWRIVGIARRYVFLLLILIQTTIASYKLNSILLYQNLSCIKLIHNFNYSILKYFEKTILYALHTTILLLFFILFFWVSASFWTALMGFIQLSVKNDKFSISKNHIKKKLNYHHRTAILMPICNENVERVFAGLKATYESIMATGQIKLFDIYILSDSYNPDICVSEQKSWIELCQETKGFSNIFYRRRHRRIKQKSGNIDDFCRRWGKKYSYMVILDADSVMSGNCLIHLVKLMESNPKAGIIQSMPKTSGMNTLYARYHQFATQVYTPLFTAGMHFWQLGESHYWGHNAIIRIQPFMKNCILSPLPGSGILSGSILSHDFVEAALMRRAGWGVWIAYDIPGSYEEPPPNLLDELKRDRRWCYGNLMNFRLFLVRGLHPVHRIVFLTGVMSYLSAPLWFAFLILSTILQIIYNIKFQYISAINSYFHFFPYWYLKIATELFFVTLFLLFLPKLFSIMLIIAKNPKPFGGAKCFILSILLEIIFSMFFTPIKMVCHTFFIFSACIGRPITWKSPKRNNDITSWRDAFKHHLSQVLIGISWTLGLIFYINFKYLFWFIPILSALIMSPLISVYSSYSTIGLFLKKLNLFLIPEEYLPPKELVNTKKYFKINQSRLLKNGFFQAIIHPAYNALAITFANSRHNHSNLLEINRQRYLNIVFLKGIKKLDIFERLFILNDPVILNKLHFLIWLKSKKNLIESK